MQSFDHDQAKQVFPSNPCLLGPESGEISLDADFNMAVKIPGADNEDNVWLSKYPYSNKESKKYNWIDMEFTIETSVSGFRTKTPSTKYGFKDFTFQYLDGRNWTNIISGTRSKDCCYWVEVKFSVIKSLKFRLFISSTWDSEMAAISRLQLSFAEGNRNIK